MIEASLTHDGGVWVARSGSWTARGRTLAELDRAVAGILRKRATVRMHFDCAAFPAWIRQYSQHYFNRLVTIEAPTGRE